MNHHAPTAAIAAFLGIVCLEGFLVFVWKLLGDVNLVVHAPMPHGEARMAKRKEFFLWLGLAVLFEGAHDLMRTSYYVYRLDVWPQWLSFWITTFEAVAVVGLIHTFTNRDCGNWGWTIAMILPTFVALGVLFR